MSLFFAEINDDCMCIHATKVQREREYRDMTRGTEEISSLQHGNQSNVQQKRGISSHKVLQNFQQQHELIRSRNVHNCYVHIPNTLSLQGNPGSTVV
jgi:hypothetical protein